MSNTYHMRNSGVSKILALTLGSGQKHNMLRSECFDFCLIFCGKATCKCKVFVFLAITKTRFLLDFHSSSLSEGSERCLSFRSFLQYNNTILHQILRGFCVTLSHLEFMVGGSLRALSLFTRYDTDIVCTVSFYGISALLFSVAWRNKKLHGFF